MAKTQTPCPPYLIGSQFRDPEFQRPDKFPFNLPWLAEFELAFPTAVTMYLLTIRDA